MMWSEDTYTVLMKEHGACLLHRSGGILRVQLAGTVPFSPVKHVIMISFPRSKPALKRTIPFLQFVILVLPHSL